VSEELEPRKQRPPRPVNEAAQKKYLDTLAKGYPMSQAAKAAGFDRRRFSELRDRDEPFAAAERDAYERGTDVYREKLRELALEGTERMVVSAGKVLGKDKQFDPRFLLAELKRRDPAYRDNAQNAVNVNLNGSPTVKIQQGVTFDDVAAVLAKAGALKQFGIDAIEAPAGTAEIVEEHDEPAE
jgi:hypothetical protein